MTPRERDVVTFMEACAAEHGAVAPSITEIGEGIGLRSRSGVHRMLTSLQQQGVVQHRPGKARGYELTARSDLSGVSDADLLAEAVRRGLIRGAV